MDTRNIKQNNTAEEGDVLFLTKPLGVGILTTAEKKGILKPGHEDLAAKQMMQLNKIGEVLGSMKEISSMTDVTGFGLLGHLVEMAEGSGLSATINFDSVPLITQDLFEYLERKAVPGGTNRNWDSYGDKISISEDFDTRKNILADPQTSGGLLIAVKKSAVKKLQELLADSGLQHAAQPIGTITAKQEFVSKCDLKFVIVDNENSAAGINYFVVAMLNS